MIYRFNEPKFLPQLFHSAVDVLRGLKQIVNHHRVIARKKRYCRDWRSSKANSTDDVTICLTNCNNRFPLELTLRSLIATNDLSSRQVLVADNESTDGSLEMLNRLSERYPIKVLTGRRQPQHAWYDEFDRIVSTKYWIGIHEDLLFLGHDWIGDMIRFMDANPNAILLGGEAFPAQDSVIEPVSDSVVDMQESLSTWIFCVKTGIHKQAKTSFAYHKRWDVERNRYALYDLGGKLIEDIRTAGWEFHCMPTVFMNKWHHLANITWSFKHKMSPGMKLFKSHQIRDAERRAKKLRKEQEPA